MSQCSCMSVQHQEWLNTAGQYSLLLLRLGAHQKDCSGSCNFQVVVHCNCMRSHCISLHCKSECPNLLSLGKARAAILWAMLQGM